MNYKWKLDFFSLEGEHLKSTELDAFNWGALDGRLKNGSAAYRVDVSYMGDLIFTAINHLNVPADLDKIIAEKN